jgi:hypothetical protein
MVKNNFSMILSWKDSNFLSIKLFKVQIYNFFCGTRLWQGIQKKKYLETNPTWRVYGETINGACFWWIMIVRNNQNLMTFFYLWHLAYIMFSICNDLESTILSTKLPSCKMKGIWFD